MRAADEMLILIKIIKLAGICEYIIENFFNNHNYKINHKV